MGRFPTSHFQIKVFMHNVNILSCSVIESRGFAMDTALLGGDEKQKTTELLLANSLMPCPDSGIGN